MINNYYFQKNSTPYINIWDEFGIYVQKTKGLNLLPKAKKPFFRNWADEQGDDTFLPSTTLFESRDITLSFVIDKAQVDNARSALKSFYEYITSGPDFSYFDTFKKEGFRGYYDASKINSESFRETKTTIELELDFIAPNGICFGFDNSNHSSIFVEVLSGSGDIYFSDGVQHLGVTESFIKNQTGGFAITCPSVLGGVVIAERVSKVLGINGKVLGINGKVLGI